MHQQPGDPAAAAELLHSRELLAVLEVLVGLDETGECEGLSPLAILRDNLPLIEALGIGHVHWHLYSLADGVSTATLPDLADQCKRAVGLGELHGFHMGIENNSPEGQLFVSAEECARLLESVPGLGLVWDLNHTVPGEADGFLDLVHAMQMLHVSDTPLPETNHHLPLGRGSVPVGRYMEQIRHGGFDGPMILEIGGHAISGGHAQDTDAALQQSRNAVEAAWATAG